MDAAIGAYQVEERPDGGVVVTDLSVGEVVAVLDIGSEMVTEPGGFLIGRLVPIDERPGLVFESPPLAVDEQSAREIAALRPAGSGDRWVDVLARARAAGRVASDFSRAFRDSVVTDVEPTLLLVSGNQEDEFADVARRSEAGEDEVGRAAFRLLKCAWLLEARLRDEAVACLATPHRIDPVAGRLRPGADRADPGLPILRLGDVCPGGGRAGRVTLRGAGVAVGPERRRSA